MTLGLALCFTACNKKPSLMGTWLYLPQEHSTTSEFGFSLQKDGTAAAINISNTEYTSWEKKGDQLILKGKNTGINPGPVTDTLWIDELTEEHLVVKDLGNNSFTYQRKIEN